MELKDLKAGDPVFMINCLGRTLRTVEKITPNGYIKVQGILYNPDSGFARGGNDWHTSHLAVATHEGIEEYRKLRIIHNCIYEMHNYSGKLSYEQAVAIDKILRGDQE